MKKLCVFLASVVFVGINLLQAQTVQITGTVTSAEDGMPLPGASIQVKGTTVGTATDFDGKYSINVPQTATTLVFRSVGMLTQEIQIEGRTTIDLVMEPDATELEEVIVVAYGTTTRSSFTGSAGTVKKEQMEKIQTTNFTKALEGAVAGVQVVGVAGQPGSSGAIRIRGIGSINASSNPLIIVDGAAFDGDYNSIPSDDIENITVLKDASAAALYGARGANGVIMITTKKGRAGKTMVNVKANYGVTTRAIPEYDRVSTDQWMEKQFEAERNYFLAAGLGLNPGSATEAQIMQGATWALNNQNAYLGGYNPYSLPYAELMDPVTGKLNPNAKLLYQDDWQKELSQLGGRHDYTVSFSGGDEKTSFYGSMNYLNEDGHVRWSSYDRFSGRVGVNSQVTSWFKIDGGISGNTSSQAGFLAEGTYTTNPFYYARMMGPIYPIYQRDADGKILTLPDGSPKYDIGDGGKTHIYGGWTGHKRPYAPNSNLVLTLPLDDRSNTRNQLSARFAGEASFLKDFTFRVMGSTDLENRYYTTYQNYKFADAEGVAGRSTKEMFRVHSYTFNQVLTYNKAFNDHNITVMAGHENYGLKSNDLWATRTSYIFATTEIGMGSVAEGSSSYEDNYTLEGFFGQAKYSFANKYFVDASLRRDASSRFEKNSRWGTFWSAGASWRVKQEDFLADVDWLNDLRIKVSYGEQGNDGIGNYRFYSLFDLDDRNNGNINGAWYAQLPNPDLQWEKNSNLNTGFDFSVLNSRLRGGFEYFMRKSDNLLFAVPRPSSTGISSRFENIGSMENKGIELNLSADIVRNNKFSWTLDLNATHYKNVVTKTPLNAQGEYLEIISGSKKIAVGQSIYDFWLRDFAGVDPANGDALYYMDQKDADGNVTGKTTTNAINSASYYYCGSAIPDLYGGITNTFKFMGFDASVFLTYQLGGLQYDAGYAALMHAGGRGVHWHADILDSWSLDNPNSSIPRVEYNSSNLAAASSRFLVDASFLSIRNVTIGYTLPKNLINKLEFSSLRVFVAGDNLAMFSKRKGMDPQQSFGGTTDYTYIPVRITSFGLNLTF